MDADTHTPHPLDGLVNYREFLSGLVGDLAELRSGTITVAQARARAEIAKQIVRGVAVGLDAQRLLMDLAKPVKGLAAPDRAKR